MDLDDGRGPRWVDGNHRHPTARQVYQTNRNVGRWRDQHRVRRRNPAMNFRIQPSPISDQEAWRRARSDVNWTAPPAQGAARAEQLRWRRNNLSQYRERASHNPAAVRRLRALAYGR